MFLTDLCLGSFGGGSCPPPKEEERTYCVTTLWPCISLDSPPWQLRQNCAALLLVLLFPGSYQPRTKKWVGLITVPSPLVSKYCILCWSWQVVQVIQELV